MNPALNLFQSIGVPLLALVFIAVIGWVAISRIRAWMKPSDDTDEGFTLADLRRLNREGSLSDEEFERAQAQLIAAVRRKPSKKDAPLPKHPPIANSLDHRIQPRRGTDTRADTRADTSAEAGPEPRQRPTARPESDGRIVIRDEGSESPNGAPQPPARPKRPADPRTDADRG